MHGKCLSDAGYHSSSACSHTVEALTDTLPGRHLSCLTTEEEWGLGPAEGDKQGWRKFTVHLFHFPLPGPKELKPLANVSSFSSPSSPTKGQGARSREEVMQNDASPPFLPSQAPSSMLKMSDLRLIILKSLLVQNPIPGARGTHLTLAPRDFIVQNRGQQTTACRPNLAQWLSESTALLAHSHAHALTHHLCRWWLCRTTVDCAP